MSFLSNKIWYWLMLQPFEKKKYTVARSIIIKTYFKISLFCNLFNNHIQFDQFLQDLTMLPINLQSNNY